jgi:nickel superoxide dismutase
MKKIGVWIFIASFCLLFLPKVFSHCQIPCGIYNDELRFEMMKEHLLTIEKSMKQINELFEQLGNNANQIVRWVMNKEQHADEFAHIVTFYFLSQRIKIVDEKDSTAFKDYLVKVSLLHEMLVYAMKAKQTTDVSHVEKLRSLVQDFHKVYFSK